MKIASSTSPPLVVDDIGERSAGELSALLAEPRQVQRHALLVMVSTGTTEAWTADADATLTAIRDALVTRRGFAADNVVMLCDPDKDTLLRACDDLTARVGDQPAWFQFIGPGFDGDETWIGRPSVAGTRWVASLGEIGSHLPRANLTAAIFMTRDHLWHEAIASDAAEAADEPRDLSQLGRTTIVVLPTQVRPALEESAPDRRWLVDALVEHGHVSLSAREWCAHMPGSGACSMRGDEDSPLFSYFSARSAALKALREIEQAPLRRMLPLPTRLAADPELAAEACLHRAIVAGELGSYAEARSELDAAEQRHRQRHARNGEGQPPSWPELHYQRGRMLFDAAEVKQAEYTEAIAALTAAVRSDPDHARGHYYRALAIRRLIEGDLERQAHTSEQRYRDLGAPLGIDDDTSDPSGEDAVISTEVRLPSADD